QEQDLRGGASGGRGQGNAIRVQLADPVSNGDAPIGVQRFRSGKERKRVALVAHSHKQQIETRKLASLQLEMRRDRFLVFAGGLLGVRILALDSRNLVRF